MKFKIKLSFLLELLNPLVAVVNDNHIVPLLRSVKITIKKNKIIIIGNDLEIECLKSGKLETKLNTSFCVNFSMLLSSLKSIRDEYVEILIRNSRIDIFHKKGSFELPTEDSGDYPTTNKISFSNSAKIKGISFKNTLKVANKFIGQEELEAMSNIHLSIGKKIFIRSTDRNRLFEEKIKGNGDKASMLLSGKVSVALFSLLEDFDIDMMYNENKVFLKFKNTEIFLVQQQGDFPEAMFKKLLSSIKKASPIEVDLGEFKEALKRVSVLSNREKFSAIKTTFYKKKLKINWSGELSSSKIEEALDIKFNKEIEIGYNSKYLIEILSVFTDKAKVFINQQNCFCIKENKKTGMIAPFLIDG